MTGQEPRVPPEPLTIERYVHWAAGPEPDPEGGWVQYEDHAEALRAAEAQRDRLRAAPSWEEWVEAGFLDAYLNIAGVRDEARATELLREDIERLFGGAALSDPTQEGGQ